MFFQEIAPSRSGELGRSKDPQSPGEPIVLILEHVPVVPGWPIREQHALGRMQPIQTSYETFER